MSEPSTELVGAGAVVCHVVSRCAPNGFSWKRRPSFPRWILSPLLAPLLIGSALASEPTRSLTFVPQLGHAGFVDALAISQDGSLALSGDTDGTVLVWDLRTERVLRRLEATEELVSSVSVSPDGKLGASADTSGNIAVWELMTGRQLESWKYTHDSTTWVQFAPDGKRLVSADYGGQVALWELGRGDAVWSRYSPAGEPVSVDVSRDGDRLVFATWQGAVIQWGMDGRDLSTLQVHEDCASEARYVGEGERVLSLSCDDELVFADLNSGERLWAVQAHDGADTSLAVSWAGDIAVTGSDDGTVAVWNLDTAALSHRLERDEHLYMSIAIHPDGASFLAGAEDGTIDRWSLPAGEPLWPLRGRVAPLRSVSFAEDGRSLAVGSDNGEVGLWDLRNGALTREIVAGDMPIQGLSFLPEEGGLLVAVEDGVLQVWDPESGALTREMERRGSELADVVPLPGGKRAIAGGWDETLVLWDLEQERAVRRMKKAPGWIESMTITSSGDRAIAGTWDDVLAVWDLASGKLLHQHQVSDVVTALALAPPGDRVFAGSQDGKLVLRELEMAGILAAYFEDSSTVRALAVDEPHGLVYVGRDDGSVDVHRIDRLQLVKSLGRHSGPVSDLALSPSGDLLASSSEDGTVRIWNLEDGRAMALASGIGEWLVFDDSGHFDGSRRGGELAAAIRGLESYQLDQLAAVLNRPDLVLDVSRRTKEARLEHYRSLVERRWQKLGLDEGAGLTLASAPTVLLEGVRANGKQAELVFSATTGGSGLDSYDIHVNHTLVRHGALSGSEAQEIAETVELGCGRNLIEVSALDASGLRSLRAHHVLSYEGECSSSLFYVGLGVSKYQDASLDLAYADRDVQDLAALFESMEGSYERVLAATYTNAEATPSTLQEMTTLLEQAGVDDTVVVLLAGHGRYSTGPAAEYYFLPHGANLGDLAGTAVSFESIEELLAGTQARRKLLLLDTCEAGERIPADGEAVAMAAAEAGLTPRMARSTQIVDTPSKPRPYLFEHDRYLHNDLRLRTGSVVFSAARGDEVSYELDEYENGVFTEALMATLRSKEADGDGDGWISVQELRHDVTRRVVEMTDDRQHPTVDRDNVEQGFGFPVGGDE